MICMLEKYSIAWSFHTNTVRWEHNMLPLTEESAVIPSFKEYPDMPIFSLPDVPMPDAPLNRLLSGRHSCRDFESSSIRQEILSSILRSGYGIINKTFLKNVEFYERTVPSGGGLYPLDIYLIANNIEGLDAGIYHYSVLNHALEQIRKTTLPKFMITNLFMNQPYVSESAVVFIITSTVERNMVKYADRGYRYILFEAGHIAQNINLAALALGIGTLNLGGFFDTQVAALLNIDIEEEIPLYAIAAGHPRKGSAKNDLRMPEEESH